MAKLLCNDNNDESIDRVAVVEMIPMVVMMLIMMMWPPPPYHHDLHLSAMMTRALLVCFYMP